MTESQVGIGTLLARSLYGLYGWTVFGVCALIALVGVLVIPVADWRAKLTSAMARAVFQLGGVSPKIQGLENVPAGNAVLVANHASYVDGVLLKGYMPYRFSFVIKGEMRDVPVAHFLLREVHGLYHFGEDTGSGRVGSGDVAGVPGVRRAGVDEK